jgi:CheY-like chemotaxis protein/anti-sigma regulatory factor (Ser/Thr protein kinase)
MHLRHFMSGWLDADTRQPNVDSQLGLAWHYTTAIHRARLRALQEFSGGFEMTSSVSNGRHVLVVDDDRALRHAVTALLHEAGYTTDQAGDGLEALDKLRQRQADVILLDIGLPGMSGLEVLTHARNAPTPPRVVMMTADDTPEALLRSFRGQAHSFVRKPFAPRRIVDVVNDVFAASPAANLPIEVVSARPEWLEVVAPCSLAVAERVQEFVMQLDAKLPDDIRESVAQAFRELLSNAIEWGGRLDATRQVRISCLHAKRMLLYRIADPGEGFDIDHLTHAAISNPEGDPLGHDRVRREMGLRPGGLGLVMTRALVDELIYNEKRNEVILVKYLD